MMHLEKLEAAFCGSLRLLLSIRKKKKYLHVFQDKQCKYFVCITSQSLTDYSWRRFQSIRIDPIVRAYKLNGVKPSTIDNILNGRIDHCNRVSWWVLFFLLATIVAMIVMGINLAIRSWVSIDNIEWEFYCLVINSIGLLSSLSFLGLVLYRSYRIRQWRMLVPTSSTGSIGPM